MVTVTIEREGYKVEALVGGIDTGPGIAPGLEVKEVIETWISDPTAYAAEWGDAELDDVVAQERAEIDDELLDAAESEIANDDSWCDAEDDYAEVW